MKLCRGNNTDVEHSSMDNNKNNFILLSVTNARARLVIGECSINKNTGCHKKRNCTVTLDRKIQIIRFR